MIYSTKFFGSSYNLYTKGNDATSKGNQAMRTKTTQTRTYNG